MLIFTNTVSAEIDNIVVKDKLNDVDDGSDVNNINRPSMDIHSVSCEKDGKTVTLALKLNGEFYSSSDEIFIYTFALVTIRNAYLAIYTNFDESTGELLDEATFTLVDENEKEVAHEDPTLDTNTLSVTFNLQNSKDRIIYCFSEMVMEASLISQEGYFDSLLPILEDEESFIDVDSGGPYSGKTGDTILFNGSLDEGDSSDYEWLWTIDQTNDVFGGIGETNPSKVFNSPGEYDGNLYLVNESGAVGGAYFLVTITGSSSGGNGDDDGGGFGLTTFIILIVIIAIIGVAIVFFVMRR